MQDRGVEGEYSQKEHLSKDKRSDPYSELQD
jgi:hypothetical protein